MPSEAQDPAGDKPSNPAPEESEPRSDPGDPDESRPWRPSVDPVRRGPRFDWKEPASAQGSDSFIQLRPMSDFPLAASSGSLARKKDFQEIGPFGVTWSRNPDTADIHVALDIPAALASESAILRIAVGNDQPQEVVMLLILRPFEDGQYLVGDVKFDDPSGTIRLGVSPTPIDPSQFPEELLTLVTPSVHGSSPAGILAWRKLRDQLPSGSRLREFITQALS